MNRVPPPPDLALPAALQEPWPVGCQLLDGQGRLLDVNTAWLAQLGYRREEVVGRPFADFLTPGGRAVFTEQWPGFQERGDIAGCELELRHKDGRVLMMSLDGACRRDPEGRLPPACCLLRDITPWKQTEAELKENAAAFQGLFDAGPTAVALIVDRKILRVNALMSKITGYSNSELVGQSSRVHYMDDTEFERVGRELYGAVNRDGFGMTEARHRRKNGEVYDVLLCARSVDPTVPGGAVVVTVLDITKRKQAEAALRESDRNYQDVFNATSDALFVHEMPSGRVVDVNDAMVRMFGYGSKEEVMACPAETMCVNEPGYSLADAVERLNRAVTEGPQSFEWRARRKSGELFWVEVALRSSRIGGSARVLASVRDITERKQAEAALRESELFLKRSQAAARIGSYVLEIPNLNPGDQKWRNSPLMDEIFGIDASYPRTGETWLSLIVQREEVQRYFDQIIAARHTRFEKEYQIIRHRDGARRWISALGELEFDARGQPLRLLGTVQDITDRKEAEAALRQSEARLREIIDHTNDIVFSVRVEGGGRFVYDNMNVAIERYGVVAASFRTGANTPGDLYPPELAAQLNAEYSRCVAARQMIEIEQLIDTPLGLRSFATRLVPVFSPDGSTVVRVIGFAQDTTERKQAEERVSEQAALLDAANDAIYVRKLDHTVTYWNDGAERVFEWPRAEALGRKFTDLINYGREAFESAQAMLRERGSWSGELKRTRKSGQEAVIFCRWTLLRDRQGRPKEILAINTDITEQKQLEANFLRAQRMEGIGALAGGIAHDLNNILQPILMTVPMLAETTTDPESREMLDTVESCAQRGADIIRQLLTFARGAPGTRVPLPLRHLMRDTEKIIRETFPRNIQTAIDAPPDLWPVMGDATQIHQVLMNLCVNARDAMPDGGKITLAAANQQLDEAFSAMMPGAKPGPHVCVSVTDTGTGIPPELLDRIFDPFFTTKEIGKGTGLGLPTVLGVVRGHGGFVRVDSKPGWGTAFQLYFPASPDTQAAVLKGAGALPPRAAGELILVVDDEASVRSIVQRTLEKHGYRVVTATEGSEALAFFARHQKEIRAVLTDMMMPGMDGPTLVRALRQQHPQLPILGMTGLGEKAAIKGFRMSDLTRLLAKPFNSAELLDTLHQTLFAPGPNGGPA
jgi:PAS domain S-box-containing protein